MAVKSIVFLIVLLGSFGIFGYSFRRMIRFISIGKPENRFDHPWQRVRRMMTVALGQTKLFREPVAGFMHAFIFWGFLVLLSSIAETIVEGLLPGLSFRLHGTFYDVLGFCQELFAGLVIVGVIVALYRRFILRPKRLQVDTHAQIHAAIILCTILMIMISMLGQNSARIALVADQQGRFLSAALTPIFTSGNASTNRFIFEICWWMHITLVLGFLNYLPYSKHAHILTSVPNVFLTSLKPYGALQVRSSGC